MANNTPVTRDDIAKMLEPFFYVKLCYRQDKADKAGAYNCALCRTDIGDKGQTYAISYNVSRYGTWAHPNCVKKLGFTVSTDDKAMLTARQTAQANNTARLAAKAALVATPPPATPAPTEPTISLDTFEAELRSKIEGEYDALLDQAIERFDALTATITAQNEQIRLLQLELEMVKSAASEPYFEPVPTEAMTNARQNDSGLTDDEKRAARAQKRADRQARLGKVA